MSELEEQIKVVAEARQRANKLADKKRASYKEWEEQNALGIGELVSAEQEVVGAEALLRELTLQAYSETGNKAPAVGVGIREVTTYAYDTKVALDWAKAHKLALKLDETAFKKIAKADPPDFVKISTEPQATIATNLEIKEG